MRLARALGASGQLAEALGRARYAVSLARGREKAEAQLILAFVHLERGEAKLALAQCDRAGRLEPELVEVWSMRGLALLRLGRDAEASQSLEKAAALAEQQDDPELARSIRELR
jgi:Flp pilus assembly protein TadD